MLIDLHVHAPPSDSALAPFIARAAEVGLDGFAVLGDDAFAGVAAFRARDDVVVFGGAEVVTDRGHYLLFVPEFERLPPLDELLGPRVEGVWPVRDVLVRAQALGGAVVAAHPYDVSVDHPGGDILFTVPYVSAVEAVFSARPPGFSRPAVEAADVLGLPCVGGSGAREPDMLGDAATLFADEFRDEAGLVKALRSGSCWPVDRSAPPPALLHPCSRPSSGAADSSHHDGAPAYPRRRR